MEKLTQSIISLPDPTKKMKFNLVKGLAGYQWPHFIRLLLSIDNYFSLVLDLLVCEDR
jgi:hypothetical protein